jgi:membrane protein involved in colicin uptake
MNTTKDTIETEDTQPKGMGIREALLAKHKAEQDRFNAEREAERKAKEEAQKKAREEAERKAKEEAERNKPKPYKKNEAERARVLELNETQYKMTKAVVDAWNALKAEQEKRGWAFYPWAIQPTPQAAFEGNLNGLIAEAEYILLNFESYCRRRNI